MKIIQNYLYDVLIYTAVMTLFASAAPGGAYRRYIGFTGGLVLLEIIIKPILEIVKLVIG